MRYQGGKSRIAKYIVPFITVNASKTRNSLVSLFCGSCAIESKVAGFEKLYLNDSNPYLIALFQGLQNGRVPPENVTIEEYRYTRNHQEEDPFLTGFIGFGCSFGGGFFGGYARDKSGRNYARESRESLLKEIEAFPKSKATFTCMDYKNVFLPENCVVYADPPYDGTTRIGRSAFNSEEFWEYMRQISNEHIVLISEQNAPFDFSSIWERPYTRTLDRNKENQFKVTEKLFVYRNGKFFKENF